ncbi:hypothetical protein [Thermogemmatispora onikobensis]|uniref:hypothetical protein n=1 Tax=Thermogemmatispora onikobensis TaxID=732234 RepID=UPI000852B42F|nr:hypothetical protein [Thermogemmatispora onikobensis]
MPFTRPDDPANRSSDWVLYPLDALRNAAATILVKASLARDQHDQSWASVQCWLDEESPDGYYPPPTPAGVIDRAVDRWWDDSPTNPAQYQYEQHQSRLSTIEVRSYLRSVLVPYARRLRAAYDWQIKLAQALFDLIQQVGDLDQQMQSRFQQSSQTSQPAHGYAPSSDNPTAF